MLVEYNSDREGAINPIRLWSTGITVSTNIYNPWCFRPSLGGGEQQESRHAGK